MHIFRLQYFANHVNTKQNFMPNKNSKFSNSFAKLSAPLFVLASPLVLSNSNKAFFIWGAYYVILELKF